MKLTEEDQAAIKKAVGIFDEDNSLEDKELVSGEKENVEKVLELMTIQSRMEEKMTEDVDTEAVSYTHLDVYKRQVQCCL